MTRRRAAAVRTATAVGALVGMVLAGCTVGGDDETSSAPSPPRGRDAAAAATTPTQAPDPELRSMAMWARGDLLVDVVPRALALDGVVAATHVRSDTLGLVGSTDADGTVVDDLGDGFRVPVEVGAIDPAGVEALLADASTAATLAALQPGEVLLTETGADLRGVGVGGHLDLVDRPGLLVVGIVPDGTVGRAEVVAHVDDADALGLEPDGTLLLAHRPDAPATLADEVEALAPPDVAVRVVTPDRGEQAGRAPLVLPLSEVKARFGEFAYRPREGTREVDVEAAWRQEHLVAAEVPILGTVYCHQGIIEDLTTALQGVVDAGFASTIDPDDYSGCYVGRRIGTDSSQLSRHAWGIALDINVDVSLPGLGPPPPDEVVDIFESAGFRWGGDFLSPDNHHFEWVGTGAG